MRPLLRVLRLLLSAAPGAMARGALLSALVLMMGAALLGLSGWFITATGMAGLAGIGIAFDVFRPSAGVRFLALGRTVARYGERVLTHDATLRALAALRVQLLRDHARRDGQSLARLRGEGQLTRIVADVDALDGLVLRLMLPLLAGVATHAVVFAGLAWLVDWRVALAILMIHLVGGGVILTRLTRRSMAPSVQAEETAQALRRGQIDMLRDREALIMSGRLGAQEARLIALDVTAREAGGALDRAERNAGALLSGVVTLGAAVALAGGGWLVVRGGVDPARAAIALLVALALAEALLPLRRGVAELGRMRVAAGRVVPEEVVPERGGGGFSPGGPVLAVARDGLRFEVAAGETVALTGPSGAGKSRLLMQIAGLEPGEGLAVLGLPPQACDEDALRGVVSMLPQRSALMAGTVREALLLSGPAEDAALQEVLRVVRLDGEIAARGGLDMRLGEGGRGLSGGQARRLCLARVLLRRPRLLLLDEPTEGLDPEMAAEVLASVRRYLPEAAIVAAVHREAGHPVFTQRRRIPM
ncbi:ABC transporter ATP-binding protein [Primorskyibacter flagellatus]|uniref:ABC transporter ATP-binding protein n=1 Tax=Primorskyibacter flagellatus TaxID=1387277 RepID=A0A916ZWC8_9RHOB|nr:ATP-binding cassette domain-containing protein [Primorskyibacter flagellatus]GGE16126.1 ABC transporter ATP-binding protein [Primorskyibacter flagellatus]